MTALTERIPLDDLTAQAREVRFGRTVLAAVAFLLILLGRVHRVCVAGAGVVFPGGPHGVA